MKTISLDLGCGKNTRNHYKSDFLMGLDMFPIADLQADLVWEPIPCPDNSYDYITAFDFIEHIPRVVYVDKEAKYPFIDLMNEIWRVLKPGGLFYSSTPAFPHPAAFQDPTHVNIITPDTWGEYFDDKKRWASVYGFKGAFHIQSMGYLNQHLQCEMRKVSV
jgi:SAM-dependent methyltransferase